MKQGCTTQMLMRAKKINIVELAGWIQEKNYVPGYA
jgi:hypothetical protein